MKLTELNNHLDYLKYTQRHLTLARRKFEENKNEGKFMRENYIDYDILTMAIECVEKEIERFENKDWQ